MPYPAFYTRLDTDEYQPTEACLGPWGAHLLHGGPPMALLAHALHQHPSAPGLQLARITAEFLGPVPLAPCRTRVRTLRPGRRIELLQAELWCGAQQVLLAHAWRLERLPGSVPPVPDPFLPPALPESQPPQFFRGLDFPYLHALEWRFTQGSFAETGPATVWARPKIPLIADTPGHPLDALLVMLDSANGISAELDILDWQFVPVDLNLQLQRLPETLWCGMAAQSILSPDGIGSSMTKVFDQHGALGRSLHTLFIRKK